MKNIFILIGGIIGATLILLAIATGFYFLNSHLQSTGFFKDVLQNYKDEPDSYFKWSFIHYIFQAAEVIISIVYVISCIIFSNKYYNKYID